MIITFLEVAAPGEVSEQDRAAWESLTRLIGDCRVNTGIGDLAHQHDHYLHGKPKRSPP